MIYWFSFFLVDKILFIFNILLTVQFSLNLLSFLQTLLNFFLSNSLFLAQLSLLL